MGFWKNVQIEQQEAGFSLAEPGRLVCPCCIRDAGLRLFVSRLQLIGDGRCGFCGGPGPHGIHLQELFRYMAATIGAEWGDPYHEAAWDQEEDDYVAVRTLDSNDLLVELGEPLAHDDLREAFVDAFEHAWCQAYPYRLRPDERLASNWERFARYVREEARYLFLSTGRSGAEHPDPDEIEPAAMLEELGVSIVNSGLIRRLPAGTDLFRARQHRLEETLVTPAELGSPPRDHAGANRMSPAGIPMFYGAEDPETALAELRLVAHPRRATLARWSTARELVYLDLVDVDVPSLFDMTGRTWRPWRLFLRKFAAEMAQPVSADSGGVDYVPTQIVTEFVRHELLGGDGSPVRGIRYRSAARPGGVSWVLFIDGGGCVEAAPGWEDDPGHWLGMDPTSLRHFHPAWSEESK